MTSDRDEKIRVSRYPNAYNIETYLLKHREFVSQIQLIDDERLLSASGDSNLILWNLSDFKCVQEVDVKTYFASDKDSNLNGIDRFDFNRRDKSLMVHVFKADFLLYFKFEEEKLQFIKKIDLYEQIDFFVPILDKFYLFVYFNSDSNSVKYQIKKLTNETLVDLNESDVLENQLKSLETQLGTNIKLENIDQIKNELEKDYLSFFKTKANNMQYYYERKQERINLTANAVGKRKHTDSSSEMKNVEKKMIK